MADDHIPQLRVLSLFAGIGGIDLGLERTGGFKTIAFCEREPFCQRVLAKHWPGVPIHDDVRLLKGEDIEPIDVLVGGYPCQPFSVAGERRGEEDDRHLWPEMFRLVDELRPAWVIGENVAGHISMGLDDVLSDLESIGYTARPFVIPAVALNARHRRDRVWSVAYADPGQRHGSISAIRTGRDAADAGGETMANTAREWSDRSRGWPEPARRSEFADGGQDVAYANGNDVQGFVAGKSDAQERCGSIERPAGSCGDGIGWWATEPDVGRVAHGVPARVDRLKALGNAVVPQVAEAIGRAILATQETP